MYHGHGVIVMIAMRHYFQLKSNSECVFTAVQHACILTWKAVAPVLKPVMTRTVDDQQLAAWMKKSKAARSKFCTFARAVHECSEMYEEESR